MFILSNWLLLPICVWLMFFQMSFYDPETWVILFLWNIRFSNLLSFPLITMFWFDEVLFVVILIWLIWFWMSLSDLCVWLIVSGYVISFRDCSSPFLGLLFNDWFFEAPRIETFWLHMTLCLWSALVPIFWYGLEFIWLLRYVIDYFLKCDCCSFEEFRSEILEWLNDSFTSFLGDSLIKF